MTALVSIPRFGNNYAFIVTPTFFTVTGTIWLFIRSNPTKETEVESDPSSAVKKPKGYYLRTVTRALFFFLQSIGSGAKIVFTSRKFLRLFGTYPLAIYAHRYVEKSITSPVARRYLNNSPWSQILTGGSNLGELLGALFVFRSIGASKVHSFGYDSML
jgi:hypothetical protein